MLFCDLKLGEKFKLLHATHRPNREYTKIRPERQFDEEIRQVILANAISKGTGEDGKDEFFNMDEEINAVKI